MTVPRRLGLLVLAAALFATGSAFGQTYSVLHDFSPETGHPLAPLLQASDESLWGTTYGGGAYGAGSIFSLTPDGLGGFTYAERHAFTNGYLAAGLVQASDGLIYGVTDSGFLDRIFSIAADGSNFQTVHTLTNAEGQYPACALIQGSDGRLYGVAQGGGALNFGTVFAVSPSTGVLTVLHDFDQTHGSMPLGSLLEGADGRLYGTTLAGGSSGSGVVFAIEESADSFITLFDFTSANGRHPRAALIQLADGFLYGTTADNSSDSDPGTVFKVDTAGNNYQELHAIQPNEGGQLFGGLVQGADGLLYGTAGGIDALPNGTIYRLDSAGGNFEVVHTLTAAEGQSSQASLARATDDLLYGTTAYGAVDGNGSAFQFDPATNDVILLRAFAAPDAFNSWGSLVFGPDGFLYGTCEQGGPQGFGTVFKIDPSGAGYSIVHAFDLDVDGASPVAGLVVGSDDALYGTTGVGLFGIGGTVFRMDPGGSNFAMIHSFDINDGSQPYGVIQASDGRLYGGTFGGGQFFDGVVYGLDTDGQNFEVLHHFTSPFGMQGPLMEAADGKLYGTTQHGGALDEGTIFRIDRDGGNFEVIHEFTGPDGRFPTAGLVQGANGKLYGTAGQGGTAGDFGTVFELDPSGSNFQVLHRFGGLDGWYSYSALLKSTDGYLYGTTYIGSTIFRINPFATPAFSNVLGANFALLYAFDSPHGYAPLSGVVQDADGTLYGTTNQGGAFQGGVVYKLELAPAAKGRRPRLGVNR